MEEGSIDLTKFPIDKLGIYGIKTVYENVNDSHPLVDVDYKSLLKDNIDRDIRISKCFGQQQSLKASIERNMCSKSTRLPGIKSSMLSLEILMGNLDELQTYEYMNTIKPKNEYKLGDLHSYIEDVYEI